MNNENEQDPITDWNKDTNNFMIRFIWSLVAIAVFLTGYILGIFLYNL